MPHNNYIPGACNIGNEQLAKRKRFALKCILGTIICILFLQIFHLDKMWRLAMFFPFALSAIGFQQVYFKFCYLFGIKGLFGFGDVGEVKSIEQEEFKKLDKAKSLRMVISSIIIGLALTLFYYYY